MLGVDPGSRRTGWGLLEARPGRARLIACDVISLSSSRSFEQRLYDLQQAFHEVVHRLRPQTAAVEAPFHGVNARAALQLAHARGVLLAVLAGAGVPVVEYAPATVKKAVAMNGRAEKAQVQAMVSLLLGLDEPLKQPDLADALAVALCHSGGLGGAAPARGSSAAARRAWTRKLEGRR